MSTVRPHLLGYAKCDFEAKDTLCSTGFALITLHRHQDSDFVYQSLYGDDVQQQLSALVTGSNYLAVNSSQVARLKILWPTSEQERQKVSSLLSSCDEELLLLQQKLDALRLQKKGLMQQLLTGKIRVNATPPQPSPNREGAVTP